MVVPGALGSQRLVGALSLMVVGGGRQFQLTFVCDGAGDRLKFRPYAARNFASSVLHTRQINTPDI